MEAEKCNYIIRKQISMRRKSPQHSASLRNPPQASAILRKPPQSSASLRKCPNPQTQVGKVWWPSVSSCARIQFREAGIAITTIRDISREFGKFSESPGFFPRVREVFRESGNFSESPGSLCENPENLSNRLRARMVGSAAQWGVSSFTWLMRNGL